MFNRRNGMFWLDLLIVVVAGAWTLFHIRWAMIGHTTDDYWGIALLILFALSLILAFVHFAQERSALRATTTNESFPEPSISRFFLASIGSSALWFVVRMYECRSTVVSRWLGKSHQSCLGNEWESLNRLCRRSISQNIWRESVGARLVCLVFTACRASQRRLLLVHVSWGELAVGLGILLGILTGIAAGFGVLMNLNYLLAGTVSINPVLGMFGLFLVLSWRVCGWIGLDRWLLPALGLPWKPGALFREQETLVPQTKTTVPR